MPQKLHHAIFVKPIKPHAMNAAIHMALAMIASHIVVKKHCIIRTGTSVLFGVLMAIPLRKNLIGKNQEPDYNILNLS